MSQRLAQGLGRPVHPFGRGAGAQVPGPATLSRVLELGAASSGPGQQPVHTHAVSAGRSRAFLSSLQTGELLRLSSHLRPVIHGRSSTFVLSE